METHSTSTAPVDYTATAALRDAAQARLAIAEKSRFGTGDYVALISMGASFIVSSLSFLSTSTTVRYLLAAFPFLIASIVFVVAVRKMHTTGTMSGLDSLARRGPRGPLVLMVIGMIVFAASLPIRDLADLSEWIVPIAAVVLAASWTAAAFWAARISERELAQAQADVAELETR